MEPADVIDLARPRPGHVDLGTGYHGDLWLDLPFYPAAAIPSRVWPAAQCPLCADGEGD